MAESSSICDIPIEPGDTCVNQGDWLRGFVLYLTVATNPKEPPVKRASAWARMGDLVGGHPELAIGSTDTGYFYVVRALELDDRCPLAWFQVVRDFGSEPNGPVDAAFFQRGLAFFDRESVRMSFGEWSESQWRAVIEQQRQRGTH